MEVGCPMSDVILHFALSKIRLPAPFEIWTILALAMHIGRMLELLLFPESIPRFFISSKTFF